MKENFEKELRKINKIATKDEPTVEDIFNNVGDEFDRPEHVYNIYKLQKQKHDIIEEMHKKLLSIDNNEEVTGFTAGETHSIDHWNTKENIGSCTLLSGETVPITPGELITDGVWGISYKLVPEVPHDIRKKYIISETRRSLMRMLNDQIRHKKVLIKKRATNTYESKPDLKISSSGLLAEKLVETFFEKNIIDYKLPMEMVEVDAYEDNERKIDFLVRVPKYVRGVETNVTEKKDVGIQLTISTRDDILRLKKRQISEAIQKNISSNLHVDDIVLVNIPLTSCTNLFYQWDKNGKRPGGPEKLWDNSQKEAVFRGVLNKLLPEEKITEMWEKISDTKK